MPSIEIGTIPCAHPSEEHYDLCASAQRIQGCLLQSIRSLRDLKNPVLSLAENAKSTANVVGSSGRGRLNRYIEMGYPEEKLDDLNEPVEKPYEAGSDLSEFLISDT
jgi:hypothetical protein